MPVCRQSGIDVEAWYPRLCNSGGLPVDVDESWYDSHFDTPSEASRATSNPRDLLNFGSLYGEVQSWQPELPNDTENQAFGPVLDGRNQTHFPVSVSLLYAHQVMI